MLDIRTLLVVMVITDLILAATLWIGAGRRMREGLGPWTISLGMQALAFALFATPAYATEPGLMVLANALFALSMTFQGAALLEFDRRGLPVWVHTAVIAAIGVPFALLAGDLAGQVLFAGVAFGSLLAVLAVIALQLRAPLGHHLRGLMVGCYALGALFFVTRGITAGLSSDPIQALLIPGILQAGTQIAAYAVVLAGSCGFLLMHKERSDNAAARLATIDPLTGAYNRRTFHEIAGRELSRARRANQALSVIMLDLDHFRAINERHGHLVGDEVLKRFADVVRLQLRKEDMLARYGGEEFCVLLTEVPGPGAVVVAGRIRKAVAAEEFSVEGKPVPVTVSAGVAARLDEGPESIDELLGRADQALGIAKHRGRDRVVALSLGRSIAA